MHLNCVTNTFLLLSLLCFVFSCMIWECLTEKVNVRSTTNEGKKWLLFQIYLNFSVWMRLPVSDDNVTWLFGALLWLPWSVCLLDGQTCFLFENAATKTWKGRKKNGEKHKLKKKKEKKKRREGVNWMKYIRHNVDFFFFFGMTLS
jgi:hypothetical protein